MRRLGGAARPGRRAARAQPRAGPQASHNRQGPLQRDQRLLAPRVYRGRARRRPFPPGRDTPLQLSGRHGLFRGARRPAQDRAGQARLPGQRQGGRRRRRARARVPKARREGPAKPRAGHRGRAGGRPRRENGEREHSLRRRGHLHRRAELSRHRLDGRRL